MVSSVIETLYGRTILRKRLAQTKQIATHGRNSRLALSGLFRLLLASFLFTNSAKGEENDSLPRGPKIQVAVSAPFFETLVTDVVSGLLRIERFLLCAVLTLMVIILVFYIRERHFGRPNSVRNRAYRRRTQSHSAHLPTDTVRNHRNVSHRNVSDSI